MLKLRLQLIIVGVSGSVALGLFSQVLMQGGGQVNTRLVGQADEHKEYVGHFISQVLGGGGGKLRRLERLLAVEAGHESGHLAYFFHEYGGIGELVVIADPDGVDPLIDGLLCLCYGHGIELKKNG